MDGWIFISVLGQQVLLFHITLSGSTNQLQRDSHASSRVLTALPQSHTARDEAGRPGPPPLPASRGLGQASPYLGVRQHDVLDVGQPPGLAVLHAHIVHLVAADLAVLAALHRRVPEHLDRRRVQHLHLHLPRRSTGHCGEASKGLESLGISGWGLPLLLWDVHTLHLSPGRRGRPEQLNIPSSVSQQGRSSVGPDSEGKANFQ